MEYALSDKDIKKICPDCRVFSYTQLANMTSLSQLINPTNPNSIILYQTEGDDKSVFGHWTSICMIPSNSPPAHYSIQFFDSYGTFVDDEQKQIGKGYLVKSNQVRNKIQGLLKASPITDQHYNEHKYQIMKKGVNTCGRWSAFFLQSGLTTDEFFNFMKNAKSVIKKPYDQIIVMFTQGIIGK